MTKTYRYRPQADLNFPVARGRRLALDMVHAREPDIGNSFRFEIRKVFGIEPC